MNILNKDFWKNPNLELFLESRWLGCTITKLWWYESGSGGRWVELSGKLPLADELNNLKNGDTIEIMESSKAIARLTDCQVKCRLSDLDTICVDLVCGIERIT